MPFLTCFLLKSLTKFEGKTFWIVSDDAWTDERLLPSETAIIPIGPDPQGEGIVVDVEGEGRVVLDGNVLISPSPPEEEV